MKKSYILLIVSLYIFLPQLLAQNGSVPSAYEILITLKDNSKINSSFLTEVKDSSLVIIEKDHLKDSSFKFTEVPIKLIKRIKIRRAGKVMKALLAGAGVGLGLGLMIGLTDGDDYFNSSREARVLIIGASMMLNGLLIGGLIGSGGKKFIVEGPQENIDQIKEELKKYTISLAGPSQNP